MLIINLLMNWRDQCDGQELHRGYQAERDITLRTLQAQRYCIERLTITTDGNAQFSPDLDLFVG